MFSLEPSIPFILLLVTNVLELVGFLSSHMVDNRYLSSVHEGIFQRCTSLRHNMDRFICYWWSSDTFMEDKTSLQVCTILAFITLFLVGFVFVFGIFGYFYKKIRTRKFQYLLSSLMFLNAAIIATIVLVFTYAYATETRFIPGPKSSLIFSWSYYTLYGAFGGSIITAILFLYNPLRNSKFRS